MVRKTAILYNKRASSEVISWDIQQSELRWIDFNLRPVFSPESTTWWLKVFGFIYIFFMLIKLHPFQSKCICVHWSFWCSLSPAQSSASWKNNTETTTAVYHCLIDCLRHELSLMMATTILSHALSALWRQMTWSASFRLVQRRTLWTQVAPLHNGSVRMSNPSCDALPTQKILLAFYVCVLTDTFSHPQIHVTFAWWFGLLQYASMGVAFCYRQYFHHP